VKQNVKGQDTAARYGRREFAVIPEHRAALGDTVADHVRRAVMTKGTDEAPRPASISAASRFRSGRDLAQERYRGVAHRAHDTCLYAAKRHGRNRVMCETDPKSPANAPRSLKIKVGRFSAASAPSSLTGSICTDSPQPQAEV